MKYKKCNLCKDNFNIICKKCKKDKLNTKEKCKICEYKEIPKLKFVKEYKNCYYCKCSCCSFEAWVPKNYYENI